MHYRMLTPERLAQPARPCAMCAVPSYAAGRHPHHLCLRCEAKVRRQAGK